MKTALIVGGSRGIGRGIVENLLDRGWTVYTTVRNADTIADLKSDRLNVQILDTTDFRAIDQLRDQLPPNALDLLFVSAGVLGPMEPLADISISQFSDVMAVNVLAPLRIVDRLADRVAATGTIGVMSSHMGSITQNQSGGVELYRISKAALNQGLVSIARRRNDGHTYLLVHPGRVRTDMTGGYGEVDVRDSANGIVTIFENRSGEGGVHFVDYKNAPLPW